MPEVRVIDEKGKQLGVLPSGQAVQLAERKGLNLVEVSDTSVPPVCRIMDYGKFKYQLTRRERNSKKEHKIGN